MTPTGPADLAVVMLSGDRRPETLLGASVREAAGRIAPGGQWLAYETDETGETAIFVRPFPGVASARWRISSGGGSKPVWARDGRRLFYRSGQAIMAVDVRGTSPADWGVPAKLFEGPYAFEEGPPSFDVAPDGRFLMIREDRGETGRRTPDMVIVVQNWFDEVRRRVPNP